MIKSISDIDKIRKEKQADLMIRVNPDAEPTATGGKMHIMVCGGTGCTSSNSMKIIEPDKDKQTGERYQSREDRLLRSLR